MSGLLAVFSPNDRQLIPTLERMARSAPHRGELTHVAAAGAAFGITARSWGTRAMAPGVFHEDGLSIVSVGAIHGSEDTLLCGHEAANRVAHLYRESPTTLREIRGSLTFVLWDAVKERLVAQRDPVGLHPLFFSECDGALWFGSEVKQVVAGRGRGQRPDPEGTRQLITLDFINERHPGRRSCVAGVHRVPPRCRLEGAIGALEWSEWSPQRVALARDPTLEEAVEELRTRLIRSCTRLSQIEGVLLSGGLDSSVVAAALCDSTRQQGGPKPVAVSGIYPAIPEVDESLAISANLQALGLPWRPLQPSPRPFQGLHELSQFHDGPACGMMLSNLRAILEGAREKGLRFLADGHDGDGLFHRAPDLSKMKRLTLVARTSFWRARNRFAGTTQERPATWLTPQAFNLRLSRSRASAMPWPGPGTVDLLETTQREALRAGVEVHHPLMDQDVVDYALALPREVVQAGGRSRGILRQAYKDVLPNEVTEQTRKVEFSRLFVNGCTREDIREAVDACDAEGEYLVRDRLPDLSIEHSAYLDLADLWFILQAASASRTAA